jgi:hypothetical protein
MSTTPAPASSNFPLHQLAQDLIPFTRGQPVAQSQVINGVREIGSDGAVALANTDTTLILAASAAGAKAITTASSYPGQQVWVRLVARTGGSYTLALASGTLTLDAANEAALIVRNAAGTGWLVGCLVGATIA